MRSTLVILAALALIGAAPASALTVETAISPEFQKKLEKDFGVREGPILTEALASRVESAFARKGITADRVVVTLEDAKPNRPTFHQISARPGLDPFRSISLGGAHISGVAYDASGKEIGAADLDWYESDLSNVIGYTTWSDARSTFDRFARRFADKLS
jgi:hypothetical protein